MQTNGPLTFKIADRELEFEQIHRLNYQTFVEEIPQHECNVDQSLVDKFHEENIYIICLKGDRLLGMIAVRDKRPFSLDEKLENLDSYLPQERSMCEIRLLSVERNHRSGVIFHSLMGHLYQHCKRQGYNLAVISGTVRQRKLYEHLGFVPFGPLVGTKDAKFQPMYLTLETFEAQLKNPPGRRRRPPLAQVYVNLLPGPVRINKYVRRVFSQTPVSHRSESFVRDFRKTQRLLCDLVHSRHAEILMGSGTLANDAIAGQLSLNSKPGLILSNGEFGNRLIDHAVRFGLSFDVLQVDWGDVFNPCDVRLRLHRNSEIRWLWAVHCETSTGILNDMTMLKGLCAERGVRLCIDCISSIGTVPLDLRDVFLASGVSGKGLGAFSGLSMVFYNNRILPAPKVLPKYLDLGFYAASGGIPFTMSSNLLYALQTVLRNCRFETVFKNTANLSLWLRSRIRELELPLVGSDSSTSPAVITIALPRNINSKEIGHQIEETGYFLSYNSEYLLKRNWIQICLMGECCQEMLIPLIHRLRDLCSQGDIASRGLAQEFAG